MNLENISIAFNLEKHAVEEENVETVLNLLPDYALVDNKGQLAEDSRTYGLDEGILEEDEKPEQVGREGESRLKIGYDDIQYHLAGMAGEGDFSVEEGERLDLPEENKEEALGAVFGASYAIFRYSVMEEGFPADHGTLTQDIETEEEKQKFLEEGAYEIKGTAMGPWGYDNEKLNEIMDTEQALQTYNEVAEQIL